LLSETEGAATLLELIEKANLTAGGIRLSLKIPLPSGADEASLKVLRVYRFAPMRVKRRGAELRIIFDGKDDLPRKADPALLKAVARARRWFEEDSLDLPFIDAAIVREVTSHKPPSLPPCICLIECIRRGRT
jgi:hypothetical protein